MTYDNIDQNTHDLLFKHMEITPDTKVLIVYDTQCNLVEALHESYKKHLNNYIEIDFPNTEEEAITEIVNELPKGSLVILIQTGSFRMSKFRWRLELFQRELAVIEHPRLGHNLSEEGQTYIDSLTCEIKDNKKTADAIMKLVAQTKEFTFTSKDGSEFKITGPFEDAKPNLGIYGEERRGGGFPVGEVFTEPIDLKSFNGNLSVRAYPGLDHKTKFSDPFTVTVNEGALTFKEVPDEFRELMKLPQNENDDGRIQLREIGFGLNRHITFDKPLSEPTAFERLRGLHFSLGMKHNIYRKKIPKTVNQRYHIDIFIDVATMAADGKTFYENGAYVV